MALGRSHAQPWRTFSILCEHFLGWAGAPFLTITRGDPAPASPGIIRMLRADTPSRFPNSGHSCCAHVA